MKTMILGMGVDVVTREEALLTLLRFLDEPSNHSVYTPNPEFAMAARKDKAFLEVLNRGDLVIPDGIGIVYASKLNQVKLKERVAGYDLVQSLFDKIKNTDKTVYFLGAAPGIAEKAKIEIKKKYVGLKIVGVQDGYFDEKREKLILDEIKQLKPDILLVGLNFSRQEKWIDAHKQTLPCKIMMGVGGSFDGMSGNVKRAPELFIRLNLEWFYRLLKQPSRLKRQLQLPLFVLTVLKEKILNR